MKKKLFIIAMTVLALTAVSLSFAACKKDKAGTPKKETTQAKQETAEPSEEQKEDVAQPEEKEKEKKEDKKEKEPDKDASGNEDIKATDTTPENTAPAAAKKTEAKKTAAKKAKKVWVEPVYETVTVETGTGTTYCHGANSGGCGASWHGTKEATYQSWKAHWQAYVKRRTAEEAAKGKTYVCDHIHDDCRWVADPPKQEKVLVKKGYWKTVK